MTSEIIVEHGEGGVTTLTFNRPQALNSFSQGLQQETIDALAEMRSDPAVRVLVVAGAGRAFSAGFNLEPAAGPPPTPAQKMERYKFESARTVQFVRSVWDFPKPVIAAVHGYVLGGAFELAMLCDLTIAGESCKFGEPEIRLRTGSTYSSVLASMMPVKFAKQMLYGGAMFSAQRMYEVGMVNEVVPDDEVLATAQRRARLIALMDPRALQLSKESVNFMIENTGVFQGVQMNRTLVGILHGMEGERDPEYEAIKAEQGLGPALKWKKQRFAELE